MGKADIKDVILSDGYQMSVRHWPRQSEGGDATPVILLHSLFFTGQMFEPTASLLSQTHDCAAPTFRGQDGTGRGAHPPTVAQLAQDILVWLDETGMDQVHLVGSSMGAYVAMDLLRHRPKQVTSLVLSCCTAEVEQNPERFAKLIDFLASGPGPQTRETIAGLMFGDTALAAPGPSVSFWIERFAQTPAAMAEVAACMFAHPDYNDVLATYDGPVLLLAGQQDKAKSPADMARIATHLPQSETHVFEDAGHTPAVEVPDQFAARVSAFLTAIICDASTKEHLHAH